MAQHILGFPRKYPLWSKPEVPLQARDVRSTPDIVAKAEWISAKIQNIPVH
jgi:hypothetical protein